MKKVSLRFAAFLAIFLGCGAGRARSGAAGSGGVAGSTGVGVATAGSGADGAITNAGSESDGGTTGGDEAGQCRKVAGCGGDIVGTWTVTDSCGVGAWSTDPSPLPIACVDVMSRPVSFQTTGTISFTFDGYYKASTITNGTFEIWYPNWCVERYLDPQAQPLTCDGLSNYGVVLFPSYSAASCELMGSFCVCRLTLKPVETVEQGTWSTTTDGTLTQTPFSGQPVPGPYCVTGTTLAWSPRYKRDSAPRTFSETLTLSR